MKSLMDVHMFWFGQIELTETYYQKNIPRWFFGFDKTLDLECKNFLEELPQMEAFSLREKLAKIIVLDQFHRNAFRDSARAHAADPEALNLALSLINEKQEAYLTLPERLFLYMPLQHAEDQSLQDLSVEKFYELHREAPKEIKSWTRLGLEKALDHQKTIREFGRFPQRNKKLNRSSSPSEETYLRA
jgi:uncharacterized protein (DUF924 family)